MDYLLGQILLLPYMFDPQYLVRCEGQLLPISTNQAMFSILGTTFGGDGVRDFALPNLKGKSPDENLHYYIALNGIYPSRA